MQLTRLPVSRIVVSEVAADERRVYAQMTDGSWGVWKVSRSAAEEAARAGLVLAGYLDSKAPDYRVAGGACDCPGYQYRERCRHVAEVRNLVEG